MTFDAFTKTFPSLVSKYDSYSALAHLVEEKTKVINISGIKDYEQIWLKHIEDSLELLKTSYFVNHLASSSKNNTSVSFLDVGTGGGFPGLPLAIAYPEHDFTLLDSTNKKLIVVKEFCEQLKIDNVKTVWGRSDELNRKEEYKKKFDFVLARAVAYLPELISTTHNFLKPNGILVAYKEYDEDEIFYGRGSAESFGLKIKHVHRYRLGDSEFDRCILFISKK